MSTDPPNFSRCIDLASERLGGRALAASDEFFASKDNLLKPGDPIFDRHRYTDRGKWMDGWETRRRRGPGHDWCIVRLGVPGVVLGVDIDTSHFRGNQPRACSIDGALVDAPAPGDRPGDEGARGSGAPGHDSPGLPTPGSESRIEEEAAAWAALADAAWNEIVPETSMEPDSSNRLAVPETTRCSHLRLNLHPDGGVARLRAYGVATPDRERLLTDAPIDLVAARHGGLVLDCSDRTFSEPRNLLMPGRSLDMGDGWETRRRRGPGNDWCVLRLGCRGVIGAVEVDTLHFKGNHPERFSLEVADLTFRRGADVGAELRRDWRSVEWSEMVPPSTLGPHRRHRLEVPSGDRRPCTHARFHIYPDGGVGRLRLLGRPAAPEQDDE